MMPQEYLVKKGYVRIDSKPLDLARKNGAVEFHARLKAFSLTNKFRERNGAGLSHNNTALRDARVEANHGRCSDLEGAKAHAGGGKSKRHANHSAVAARYASLMSPFFESFGARATGSGFNAAASGRK
jgi:hypothetical protein